MWMRPILSSEDNNTNHHGNHESQATESHRHYDTSGSGRAFCVGGDAVALLEKKIIEIIYPAIMLKKITIKTIFKVKDKKFIISKFKQNISLSLCRSIMKRKLSVNVYQWIKKEEEIS